MYVAYLRIYQAVLTSIKPHVPVPDIVKDAVKKMDAFMSTYKFTDDKIKAAATAMVDRYKNQAASGRGNSLGHNVGLEVHDVGGGAGATTLEPGRIFTIEPQFRIEDEHLGIRLEDMILITETGYENMSAFVPIEVAAIEKLMLEPGLSDAQVKIKKSPSTPLGPGRP
jgi:Xaa-Pro aminopeptidase